MAATGAADALVEFTIGWAMAIVVVFFVVFVEVG
jgi:hypothetical protein